MSLRPRTAFVLRALVVVVALGALVPAARVGWDWAALDRLVGTTMQPPPPRGFDGVNWEDRDGEIVAAYVHPRWPAHAAGIRAGDVLYAYDGQQYFRADDIEQAVSRAAGRTLEVALARGPDPVRVLVRVTRYPTFLYPLGGGLWLAAGWGFGLAAFLHALAMLVAAPLAFRSRRALRSFGLIAAALVWVGGQLVRWFIIAVWGPPELVSRPLTFAFDALTLAALAGWMLFPALLLRAVLHEWPAVRSATRGWRTALFLPPALLGGAIALATVRGSVGPLPPDALVPPVLFFVCAYVAAAAGLMLVLPRLAARRAGGEGLDPGAGALAPSWDRAGSLTVFLLAVLGGLFVLGVLPPLRPESDRGAGWTIVALQLLSLAPVGLVSVASLRYGRFDAVVTRALGATATLGGLFFAFVGGLWVLAALGVRPDPVAAGLWMVLLLIIAAVLARPLRRAVSDAVMTDRQRARQALNRFGDRVRTFVDPDRLAHDSVEAVGNALDARSAVLFLRAAEGTPDARWVRAAFRPEPPHFTAAELERVWAPLQSEGRVWAADSELNESALAEADAERLRQIGVALALPVAGGRGEPAGLLALGKKSGRRAVYNLEDVEMLRALCGQLALASERLGLLEREKALVRESAEAQLAALRAQINPHFLFNALNTIAALIEEKPGEAEATVERLAALFRYVLKAGGRTFVTLEEEVSLVKQYLAIEGARFGDALKCEWAVEDDLGTTPVPAFALQTLAENAVKHGIERKRGGGTVRVEVRRDDEGSVVLTVSDSGVGIPALFSSGDGVVSSASPAFYGVGLQNIAARLERLYGRADLLQITSAPERGTVATLVLPSPLLPELAPDAPNADRG